MATGSGEVAAGDERLRGPAQGGRKGIADSHSKGAGAHDVAGEGAAAMVVGGGEKDDAGDVLKPKEASSVDIRIAMIGNVDRYDMC